MYLKKIKENHNSHAWEFVLVNFSFRKRNIKIMTQRTKRCFFLWRIFDKALYLFLYDIKFFFCIHAHSVVLYFL